MQRHDSCYSGKGVENLIFPRLENLNFIRFRYMIFPHIYTEVFHPVSEGCGACGLAWGPEAWGLKPGAWVGPEA